MAIPVSDFLTTFEVVLLDYPAYFEAGRSKLFSDVIDATLVTKPTVVTCASYEQYEVCVKNTLITSAITEDLSFPDSKSHFIVLDEAGIERIVEPEMSMYEVANRYSRNSGVCLLTGIHSPILSQILRNSDGMHFGMVVFSGETYTCYESVEDYVSRNPEPTVNSVSSSTDYLDVAIYVNIGDKVFTSDGKPVLLAEKINTGAEGIVFKTNDPLSVAKIYHRGVMTPLRWMKLIHMTQLGLKAKGICWPSELLFNSNHEPVGYLMPKAEGNTLGSVFDGQDAMTERFPEWNRMSVVEAAQQVFEKIIYLHLCGILIGDIQLKNAMIKSPDQVYLIDMDSVQLDDLPCPVGTEEFTPPELWDRSFQTFLRSPLHEDYSCGILAFAMIFCGQHPYNQRQGHETLREEISALAFPYDLMNQRNDSIPIGGYEQIWKSLPEHFRRHISKAFKEGIRFETILWYSEITAYLNDLQQKRFEDPECYNLFPYYTRKKPNPASSKTSIRRSIKDAIIHVPDQEEVISTSPAQENNPVLFNGKPISTAFLNQEQLVDVDIKRHSGYKGAIKINRTNDSSDPVQSPSEITPKTNRDSKSIIEKPERKESKHEFAVTKLSLLLIAIILLIITSLVILTYIYR